MRRVSAWRCLLVVAIALAPTGCVERNTPTESETHPVEWNTPGSADFHGARVLAKGADFCDGCHGADLRGERRAPGCDACHAGAGGHPWGWSAAADPDFHGNAVAAAGPFACRSCHGDDYGGGWSGISCSTCHAGGPSGHPDGWLDARTASFHGLRVRLAGVDDCTRCHGLGLNGGSSHKACAECHD
jgi:hypothetical protein